MASSKVTFEHVRKIAMTLPGVEEGTTYGSPCFKVRGKLIACLAIHKSAEANSLSVRTDFDQRSELLDEDPGVYYLTDHYRNYPFVLVRLSRIHRDSLKDLLSAAWRLAGTKKGRSERRR